MECVLVFPQAVTHLPVTVLELAENRVYESEDFLQTAFDDVLAIFIIGDGVEVGNFVIDFAYLFFYLLFRVFNYFWQCLD